MHNKTIIWTNQHFAIIFANRHDNYMKRILFSIVLLGLINFGSAQEFSGGVLLGFCATQVDGDQYGGYDKIGITGGFSVKFPLNKKLDLATELKYFPKGSRKSIVPDNNDYTDYRMKLHYIELPWYLNYKFQLNKKYNVGIEGGVAIGYLIKSKEQLNDYTEEYFGREFRKLDLNLLFGATYFFNDNFSFNIKSQYTFIPIREIPTGVTPFQRFTLFTNGQYNKTLCFSFYFYF